jgi:AcrR family transcriptional regulator
MALRADAHRNREELLRAGAQALAELGINASTREIARRAGLAVGTFFRHFPTKDDLLSAIVVDRSERMTALAVEVSASRLTPRAALERFTERAAEQIALDRGYVLLAGIDDDATRAAANALEEAVGRLLGRAQADGAVRADIVASDIVMLVHAATATAAPVHALRADLWRRYVTLFFDGLGAPAPRALPSPPAPNGGFGR